MGVAVERSPRSSQGYEQWFARLVERFNRPELATFAQVGSILHRFRNIGDGVVGVDVHKGYGNDKIRRLSFVLSPKDISDCQTIERHITAEDRELLGLLSGPEGLQVIVDLRRVTPSRPFGFRMELLPLQADPNFFVTQLWNHPINFDRKSAYGEEFETEVLLTLRAPIESHHLVRLKTDSVGMGTCAEENPKLVGFLENTTFWITKVISQRGAFS